MSEVPSPEPTPDHPEFWNSIYQEEDPPRWDIGEPAPPFVSYFSESPAIGPPARVLVPGCGFGNDAAFLSGLGYRVTCLDMAPLAIAGARKRFEARGVVGEFALANLFEYADVQRRGAFDVVVEHTCFCAILPERRVDYARAMGHLLRPDGLIVALFYNHGNEGGPPFNITREIVTEQFDKDFEVMKLELATNSYERRAEKELFGVLRRR